MTLYCSTSQDLAVLVPEGTSAEGTFEPPAGIVEKTRALEYREDGACTLPDGSALRLELGQLPYSLHACGGDPAAMFSLFIDGKTIFRSETYYYCHSGYLVLAVILDGRSLQRCKRLGTTSAAPESGVSYFENYQCQDDSRRLSEPVE